MPDLSEHIHRAMDTSLSVADRHAAFQVVVRRCELGASRQAYRYLRDAHLAQDAVQEAFLYAWSHLHSLRDVSAFRSWLTRVVWTQCDLIARKSRLRLVPLEMAADIPSGEPDGLRMRARAAAPESVRDAVGRLPDHERVVVDAFYSLGRSTAEVADDLNIDPTTVRTRLHSARRRLRTHIASGRDAASKKGLPEPGPEQLRTGFASGPRVEKKKGNWGPTRPQLLSESGCGRHIEKKKAPRVAYAIRGAPRRVLCAVSALLDTCLDPGPSRYARPALRSAHGAP